MTPKLLAVAITLPTSARAEPLPRGTAIAVVVKDELRVIVGDDPIAVTGNAIAKLPLSRPALPEELAQHERVLVIADAGARAEPLLPLAFALRQSCWALAAIRDGKLAGSWPAPCPAERPDKRDLAELAVYVEPAQIFVGTTSPYASSAVKPAELGERLRSARRPGGGFEMRTDLVFGVAADTTVGASAATIDTIHDAGFTNARWAPAVWLPVQFANGVGTPPPPPPPLPPVLPPTPPAIGFNPTATSEPIARVIKARAGVFRACYQKELVRTPGLQGKVVVAFDIEPDGSVSKATTTGSTLANDGVTSCIQRNFLRLQFPAMSAKARVRFPLTFTPGG